MSTYRTQEAAYWPYRAVPQVQAPAPRVNELRDDQERWYTENSPSNRMSLSLKSGIHSEISWALERVCRLSYAEQFTLTAYPGLIDGLFDWPEWYVNKGYKELSETHLLFSPNRDFAAHYRYALESIFILRNAVQNEQNATALSQHSHSLNLILAALGNLDFSQDENQEFLVHVLDIFQVLAPNLVIAASVPDASNPLIPLNRIVTKSQNRSLIIGSFLTLNAILTNPANTWHLPKAADALGAAIRFLPLFVDRPLLDAAVEHIFTHIQHPSSARAFLLHPQLADVLKVLCSMLLSEQRGSEESMVIDITKPSRSIPATTILSRDYEMTKEEFDAILELPEPQRCYEWMRNMLIQRPDAEITQVDVWNMYKDTFTPFQDKVPILGASEVIKNVSTVFPAAQAMVLAGPVQRFVVKGIDRRRLMDTSDRFKCEWDRDACTSPTQGSLSELAEHLLEHLQSTGASASNTYPCAWLTCTKVTSSLPELRAHVLTHLPSSQPQPRHPSQSDTITVAADDNSYSASNLKTRTIPPPPRTVITYQRSPADPPSHCLTALLIIRILFRTAFADVEAAPKADEDHFGFPGVVEDDTEPVDVSNLASDREGSRRGRKAFGSISKMLADIRVRDEALMEWVLEMQEAVSPGLN